MRPVESRTWQRPQVAMTAWSLIAKPGVVSFRTGAAGRWAPGGRGAGGLPCAHALLDSTISATIDPLRIMGMPWHGGVAIRSDVVIPRASARGILIVRRGPLPGT